MAFAQTALYRWGMANLEPLLETPLAELSNRLFRALLGTGVVLLGVVAVLGRSPLMIAVVGCYLFATPLYVIARARSETGSATEAESPGEDEPERADGDA